MAKQDQNVRKFSSKYVTVLPILNFHTNGVVFAYKQYFVQMNIQNVKIAWKLRLYVVFHGDEWLIAAFFYYPSSYATSIL